MVYVTGFKEGECLTDHSDINLHLDANGALETASCLGNYMVENRIVNEVNTGPWGVNGNKMTDFEQTGKHTIHAKLHLLVAAICFSL